MKLICWAYILLFFFFPFILCAQNFYGNLIGGFSTSQLSGDGLSGFNKAGLTLGAASGLNLNEKISAKIEFLFVQKGSKKPITENDPRTYKVTLNYMEVPIIFSYHYKPKIILEAGPSVGYLIGFKEEDETGVFPYSQPFNKTETCFILGINYILKENIGINVRYSNSVLYVRKLPASSIARYFDKGQFNSVLTFTLLYVLGSFQ